MIKKALGDRCQVFDGLVLMKGSPLLLASNLLKPSGPQGEADCFGERSNDNIHYCGDSAQELAQKVCEKLFWFFRGEHNFLTGKLVGFC